MSRSRSLALIIAAALTASLAPVAAGMVPAALGTPQPNLHAEGMHGVVHAKGAGATRSGAANMTYHNGAIMTSADVTPIFSGASWSTEQYPGDKIVGINAFYEGVGGTDYMRTNTEYQDSKGTAVGSGVTARPHLIDATGVGTKAPSTSTVLGAVDRALKDQTPVANGYYPVYSDIKRGSAGYCAWHSYGTLTRNGASIPVQFAFFFDLDGDSGCSVSPVDGSYGVHPTGVGPTANSAGLAALVNVSGHELSEAVTDPRNGGWYDRQGAENSDKCAWTFGSSLIEFSNGSTWKIQGNWSNAAYTAGTGSYGVRGCIDTKA